MAKYRILSLDGGGISGIVTAIIMERINSEEGITGWIESTQNGTGDVANPSVIGLSGWQQFKFLFSSGNGIIYAVVA